MKLIDTIKAASSGSINFDDDLVRTGNAPRSLEQFVNQIIGIISIVAGVLAFIYLIYSGFLYLTANGNPDQAKKGQQGIINAIIGLAIIAFAYFIVTAVVGTLD